MCVCPGKKARGARNRTKSLEPAKNEFWQGDLTMRIGVVFPQTEIGSDPAVVRDYAQLAEELGFAHILVYDHVVGANLASRPGWKPPYSHLDSFHEPLVLFSYLAGL